MCAVCRQAAQKRAGLVYRLAAGAAAVMLEDQPAFVAQWQSERFASRAEVAVFAVNAACVVPPAALEQSVGTTAAFRRRHERVRSEWFAWEDASSDLPVFEGTLPFEPDKLGTMDDQALAALVLECGIDHDLPVAPMFPPTRAEVAVRLKRLQTEVLPDYAGARGNAGRAEGASALSPYLHFGVVGPREIVATVMGADVPATTRFKFLDELLTWREWFHYKARSMRVPENYDRVPAWARRELAEHAADERPEVETLGALIRGETADETWNACHKQYLLDGWMHNNLRMYWAKRLIAMTPSPEAGWATACYLNDRLSLDGRDPSTYGNLAWAFGDAAPGYGRRPIFRLVSTRSDAAIRKRTGDAWIRQAASPEAPSLEVPNDPPGDPYLTGQLPI
jgi:deoxyribodipyrimidine photo-lyase